MTEPPDILAYLAFASRSASLRRRAESAITLTARPSSAEMKERVLEASSCSESELKGWVDDWMKRISGSSGVGISITSLLSPEYPPLLREIPDPPLILYSRGAPLSSLGQTPSLSLVGSRSADSRGFLFAKHLAEQLANAGVRVVSGLALGIDSAAHLGSLSGPSQPATVAVLGAGFDTIYPRQNAALAREIEAHGGILLSEYPPWERIRRHQFLERNRIVSGLSHGVLVVQAKERSGALTTARLALEQGREVFAVPGPHDAMLFQGCFRLLREGATLCISLDDILSQFDWKKGHFSQQMIQLTSEQKNVVQALQQQGELEVSILAQQHPGKLYKVLLELEVAGVVTLAPGDRVMLSPAYQ